VRYLREQGKKPVEVYSEIAAMLGIGEPAENWQKLAELIF